MRAVTTWGGFPAAWVCCADGTRVLWVRNPGSDVTPPSCEPVEEAPCLCAKCANKNATPGLNNRVA